MLYYSFYSYEEFKARFGPGKRENGIMIRKNRILLAHLKNPVLLKYCKEHNDYTLLHVYNMADPQKKTVEVTLSSGKNGEKLPHKVELIGKTYYSSKYEAGKFRGLCEDLDKHSIRYINVKRSRAFETRAGKLMRELILKTETGKLLSPCAVNWVAGDVLVQRWCTYTCGYTPDMELHVNDEFWEIYDNSYCRGNFGSCMTDEGRTSFYYSSAKAKAVYIMDKTGLIVARAILFTDVTDQDDKKWRLLERRYSSESDDVLKRLLVDKLIQEGYIDGYKMIGASCHDVNSFVEIDGNSLSDRKSEIERNLEETDMLSYQDFFKWYSYSRSKTYNYENPGPSYNLDTTDPNPHGDTDEDRSPWDEYHQHDRDETTLCYLHGNAINVDFENLDDLLWISPIGEYHHKDDCVYCDNCGENLLEGNVEYSKVTEEHYRCKECMEKAEDTLKQKNWYYSEHDDEWYESPDDITWINIRNEPESIYEEKSIHVDTLNHLTGNEDAWEFGEDVFDEVDPSINLLYGHKSKKKTDHEYVTVEEAV